MKRFLSFILAAIATLSLAPALSAQAPQDQQDAVLLNKIRQARFVSSKPKVQSLGILHYTDIHGDDIAVARVHDVLSKYNPYIDAVINTGDAVLYYAEATEKYPHDAQWWRQTGLPEKSLFVLGNHDGAIGSNAKGHQEASADWDFMGKAWDFDTYFADYIDAVGYTMPEGYDNPKSPYYKSCFWLKDFPDAQIRIIGIDGIHFKNNQRYFTDEQERWIKAKLDETLDPNSPVHDYSVVFASHYPLDAYEGENARWDEESHTFVYNQNETGGMVMNHRTADITNFQHPFFPRFNAEQRFSLRARILDPTAKYGYVLSETNPIGDIVQDWVNRGGKFVVWLCGHTHIDLFFYPTKYPDLLCVAATQAGSLRGSGEADRDEDLDSRFAANYYGVDTQNGLFKVVRIGLSMDRTMRTKDILCYDYIHKKVIFE